MSAGRAVLEVASGSFAGRVEGVFGEGFYVSGPAETLFAVVGHRCWPGPLHLVVDELPGLPSRHVPVSVGGGALATDRLQVRLDGCAPWAPRLPDQLCAGAPAWRDLAGCPAPDLAAVWKAVTLDLRGCDLAAATRRLQGRGTGLTPSGDDVLAGILLVAAIDPGRRRALAGLARDVRTTRLSRAFLKWAARGHSIQPAHALLEAAASGDRAGMRRAAASLAQVGATSGRALASGIALAATELRDVAARLGDPPVPAHRMTARPNEVWRRSGDRPDAHL